MDKFLCIFPRNFRPSSTSSPLKLFDKTCSGKLLGGGTVLFAAYSVYGCISMFFPRNFRHTSTQSLSKFFVKIVVINSLGGTTITYAAYTAF